MYYCQNCGKPVDSTANFCPFCGTRIQAASAISYTAASVPTLSTRPIYQVVLIGQGTCTKTLCREVLQDLLGYTVSMAKALVDSAPSAVAQNLTGQQAVYVSQALAEYGMQVAVYDNDSYVDLTRFADHSIYTSDGNFITDALKVLGTLTLTNRISNAARWNRSFLSDMLFRPTYTYAPPKRTAPRRPSVAGPAHHGPAAPGRAPVAARTPVGPKPPVPKPRVPNPRPGDVRPGARPAGPRPGNPRSSSSVLPPKDPRGRTW